MAETLTELVAKISADATSLKSGLASADKSIGSWATRNKAQLRSVGMAFTAIGAAITGALGASTKMAVDFESAFAGVRKTVDATEEEFTILSDGLRKLTKELPLTHSELAGIAEAAGQLGIEKESILDFTEVMAQLGMTTNMASQDAAMALARFANITQMSQDSFANLGAVIVDLGNNMATTEGEIVDMGMRLAGAANTVGMTEAQIMGLAAALSSVGIRAELGGTAFARVMLEMNSAVASGGDTLEEWAKIAGVSADEFRQSFKKDAAGSVMDLIASIGELQEEGADVTGVLENIGLGGIRITDALLRAAGAEDLFTNAMTIANNAWEENTALTEEARKRLETTSARMGILKNVLVDVGITVGDFIVPILKQFVDWLMPVIDNIQKWINENPTLAKTIAIISGIVGGLLLVLGPLLIMLPGIATALGILSTVFLTLLSPISIVIGIIAALVAAGIAIVKNWDWIKDKASSIWNGIKMFFLGVWVSIRDIFKKHWDKILAILFPAVGLPILIARNWGTITKIVSDIWDNVVNGIKSTWTNVVDFILSGVNWLIDKVNSVINLINKVPGVNIGEVSKVGQSESIKGYATGGIVPGPIGAPQLATVHGGETIIPANESTGNVTVQFTQPVFLNREDDMIKLTDIISKGLNRKYRLSGRL